MGVNPNSEYSSQTLVFQPKFRHSGFTICNTLEATSLMVLVLRRLMLVFSKVTFRFTERSNYTITLSPSKEDDVPVNHDLVASFVFF